MFRLCGNKGGSGRTIVRPLSGENFNLQGVVSHAMWRNSSQIIWRKRVIDLRETVTGDSQRSDLTDDQVLACGLGHCREEMLELIDLEHSFHLCQQACN